MKTFETTAVVGLDRRMILQLPPDIHPGPHRVVVVIDERPITAPQRQPLQFSAYPVGIASDTFTVRREDLYGDDGR
jgi:hypothetical protein